MTPFVWPVLCGVHVHVLCCGGGLSGFHAGTSTSFMPGFVGCCGATGSACFGLPSDSFVHNQNKELHMCMHAVLTA